MALQAFAAAETAQRTAKDDALPPPRPSAASIVACVVLFAVLWLLGALWGRSNVPVDDKVSHFVCFSAILAFLESAHYSMAILDSYGIATQMHKHAAYSGWVIGIYETWLGVGVFVVWVMLRARPNLCLEFPRAIIAQALLLHIVGAVGYAAVAGRYAPASFDDQLMLISRSMGGFGAGMWLQLGYVTLARVVPPSDKVKSIASLMFGLTAGIGVGPVLAVLCDAIHRVLGRPDELRDFSLVGVAQAAGTVVLLVCIGCFYPDLSEFIVKEEEDEQEGGAPDQNHAWESQRLGSATSTQSLASPSSISSARSLKSTPRRYTQEEEGFPEQRRVVMGCVVISMLRGLGVSSLEAATSLVLETHYQWPTAAIGVTISGTFLAVIPVRVLHSWYTESLSIVGWIRAVLCVAFVGVVLLPFWHNPWWVLMMDALVFPCLYWSDVLGTGIMQQHFLPDGSYFDANHGSLFRSLAGVMIGRTIGSASARAQVETIGFTCYCIQQVFIVLVIFGVLELVVKPNMRTA